MSQTLKTRVELDKNCDWSQVVNLVLIAEGEKTWGDIPQEKHADFGMDSIKKVLDQQSRKILSESVTSLHRPEGVVLVAQIPSKPGLDRRDRIRLAGAQVADAAKSHSLDKIHVSLQSAATEDVRLWVEGFDLAAYRFNRYKTGDKNKDKAPEAVLMVKEPLSDALPIQLREAEAVLSAIRECRDLVNETGTELNPLTFAERASRLGAEYGLKVKVRDEKALLAENFTGLNTVGKGSDFPPRMVTLAYEPDAGSGAPANVHLCLVGKGITFDTGGISIKPSSGMWEMKSDMAGAATALTALCAIAALKLPVRVSTVICLAENRPGNRAVLPGDIFTAKNGKTVMVDNTDAEGRLVLIDGLAEAGALQATHIIDMATLTGSIVRAVGPAMAGLFCNDPGFSGIIRESAARESEKFCELPLEAEYREYLDDPAADMKNVGKAEAGAITAALFLQEFVPEKAQWAHWDIAGTAFTTGTWKYYKPGATGWGVRTLVQVARRLTGSAKTPPAT